MFCRKWYTGVYVAVSKYTIHIYNNNLKFTQYVIAETPLHKKRTKFRDFVGSKFPPLTKFISYLSTIVETCKFPASVLKLKETFEISFARNFSSANLGVEGTFCLQTEMVTSPYELKSCCKRKYELYISELRLVLLILE